MEDQKILKILEKLIQEREGKANNFNSLKNDYIKNQIMVKSYEKNGRVDLAEKYLEELKSINQNITKKKLDMVVNNYEIEMLENLKENLDMAKELFNKYESEYNVKINS